MKKHQIYFTAIESSNTSNFQNTILYLGEGATAFFLNNLEAAANHGKDYKAVYDGLNTITLYLRQFPDHPAAIYFVAMDWQKTDHFVSRVGYPYKREIVPVVERILRQRIMRVVHIINTSNI